MVTTVDKHVGRRMRERRTLLGLTQQQMGAMIGVTYQQSHKYEKGTNRIASGRLYDIAQALGVDVNYFFEGMGAAPRPTPKHAEMILMRKFGELAPEDRTLALAFVNRLARS